MARRARRTAGPPADQRCRGPLPGHKQLGVRNGFAAGLPNFHQANYGQGTVYGTILFRPGRIQWRDVYDYMLDIFGRFQFDPAVTAAQRQRIFERHSIALSRHAACGNLARGERTSLLRAYEKTIWHGVTNDPGVNARAELGGSRIWVNFARLFPQGDNEVAQTLIHEMMHCAGFSHPDRRDPPHPTPDVPGDNGPYYGTPPLRAELCIAGVQSDAAAAQDTLSPARPRTCVPDGDMFTVSSESSPSIEHFSDQPEDAAAPPEDAAGGGDRDGKRGDPAEDGDLRDRLREIPHALVRLVDAPD